jgi:uncharacterized phage protein (TIGR02218 family)
MKPASIALISYLNTARGNPDAQLLMADAFLFTLNNGTTLAYTNIDVTFAYNGQTYLANSVLIDGLKYKAGVGLEVDQQQMTIAARSTDTVSGGGPFLEALREGVFDGCEIVRYRVFFSDRLGGTVVGAAILFKGRLGSIDEIGRTGAKLTVNSDLVLLDIDMPRNLYQPTCLHTLYDAGCTLNKASFGSNGTVGAGSTASVIYWPGASANFAQGTLTFSSGVLAGVSATVGSAVTGVALTMINPLEAVPAPGDAFTIYSGCDHTPATCQAKFNNLANFRGFPYVPPPQTAI